jgi:DNA-binding HxlR family transcriptional regulator
MDALIEGPAPAPADPFPHYPHDAPTNTEECARAMLPVHEVLAQVGGKWTILVFHALGGGSRRFTEIKRQIEGISQKMLTSTLRDLEKDGFVTRTITPTIPPRVDYELTDMGRELQAPLRVIGNWARSNRHRVEEARRRFAEREAETKRLAW